MLDLAVLSGSFVRNRVASFSRSDNEAATRASLARLRRSIGKPPGSIPEIWDITFRDMPGDLMGKSDTPTPGEWAICSSLALYALHQQGKDPKTQSMHMDGISLGIALRRMITEPDLEPRIKRRFNAAATSESFTELMHHMRGIVQLLHAESIPLDYERLTMDLFYFHFPQARDGIRLRWGQDYYATQKSTDKSQSKSTGNEKTGGEENEKK